MANGGRIDFTIGYKVDKTGLNDMKKQLEDISKMSATQIKIDNPSLNMKEAMSAMQKVRIAVDEIKPALDKSFDTTTGIVNLEKLRNSLQKLNLSEIQNRFNAIGPKGQQAFLNISKAALTTNVNLKQTSSLVDKMGQTLVNTLKWSFSSSIINKFTGAIQQAYGYVQHLDTSLNDIRIVTGKSADEMDRFAEKANNAAKALGASTTEYTEAALIYYQQGLSDEEAQARAETTLKAANVTGQTGREVSEELTAVWNGYKVTAEETELYVDKLAAVAATTASDLEELSTGMSKVASAANAMGVDVDQLNGMLSTIISVTRQAPETAGTALKTIFARIEDLKISGEDEDGVKLGEVSSTLDEVGVHIMDVNGDIRDLGEVIEEVAGKWDTWTDAQQTAIAQAMAGKRQYNNLLALFNNWDMYSDAVETSRNSMGTLQEQQDIYMESTAAHLQQLKTEWEDLYDSVLDNKDLNVLIDGLTKVLNLFTNIIDAVGGGKTLFTGLIALIGTKFSKQISEAFSPLIINMQNAKKNAEILSKLLQNIDVQQKNGVIGGRAATAMAKAQKEMSQYWELMSEEQINASQQTIKEIGEWEDKAEAIDLAEAALRKYVDERLKIPKADADNFKSDSLFNVGSTANTQAIQFFETQIEQIQQIQQNYKQLGNTISAVNNKIQAGDTSSGLLKGLASQLVQAKKNVKELQTLAKKGLIPKEIATEAQKNVSELYQRFRKLKTQIDEVNATEKELTKTQKELVKAQKGDKNGVVDVAKVEEAKKKVEELTKKIQRLKNDLKNSSKGYLFTDEMIKTLPRIGGQIDKTSQQYKTYIKLLKEAGLSAEEAALHIEQLDASLNKNDLAIQKKTQNITQLIGGFASLVFAMQSLSNIGDIFDNEDLSITERFGQIVTSLAIGVPMLVSALQGLKGELIGLLIPKAANLLADEGEIEATVALEVAKYGEAAAHDANTAAIIRERAAKLLLNPVTAIATGLIVALGAALIITAKAHEKELEAIRESNNVIIEHNEKVLEEVHANQQVIDSMQDLINQYKDGTLSQQDYIKQKNDLIQALDREGRVALIAADNWKEAQKALSDYKVREAEIAKEKAKENAEGSFENVLTGLDKGAGSYDEDKEEFSLQDRQVGEEGKLAVEAIIAEIRAQGLNPDDIIEIINYKDSQGNDQTDVRLKVGVEDGEVFQAFINAVDKIQSEGNYEVPSDIAKKAKQTKKDENYNKWQESQTEYLTQAEAEAGARSGIDYAQNLEEGKEAYEKFTQDLIENEGYTLDQAEEAWVKYLSGLDSEIAKRMVETQANFDVMTKSFLATYQGDASTSDYVEKAKEIQEELEAMGLSEGIGKVDSDEWLNWITSGFSVDQIAEEIRKRLHDSLVQGFGEFKESASDISNNMQQLISEGIKGEVDTSDKGVYQSLKDDVQTLIEYYPELTDQANTFLNESIIGTEKWTQAVYDLQAAFDTLELDKLTENYRKDLEKLHNQIEQIGKQETVYDDKGFATSKTIIVEPDTQKFTETVEQIMSDDYSINMEIHADITDDFDNLVSSMEKMDSMTSKIGEDFIVSAEDITELAESYPGILEGYTDLGNGTIQLNEEIAKSAMNAASEAEIASTEELKTEIENTNKKLRVKQNHYKTIVDLATKGAEDEANAEEYKNKIVTELDEIEVINNDLKTQEIVDNALTVADDSAQNAQIVSQNWESAYQNMADASEKAAQVAIENAKQVVAANKGEDASAVHGDVKTNWTGETGNKTTIDTTTPDMKQAEESNKEYFNRMKKMAQDNYDALEKEINANEAMKVEAVARLGKSVDINTNTGKKKEDSASSASKKEAQHEDYLEREVDLYREVNEQLEQIESTLGRIQKQNSYKWGKDLQKGLERENKLLDQQLDKLKQKAEIQKGDLAQRRASLEAQGIQFSKDGSSMKNAEATLDKMYAQYNSMVDTYNAMSADQQEEYKKQLEAKKKDIDKMENDLKNYESLFGEYQSILDELQELHYKQIENAVERFNNMVDVHLELDDAKKEWNDFWYEVVQDVDDTDFGGKIAQSISKLQTLVGLNGKASKSEIAELTNHLNDTVDEVTKQIASRKRGGEDSLFEDATKLSKENLEKYRDQLMDAVRKAKEEVDNIAENYTKILESAKDLIDEQVDGLEAISDHLEHNIELFKIVEGVNAYGPVIKEYEKLYQNDLKLLNTQRQSKEFWAGEIDRYEKLLATTEEGTVQWKTYSENLKTASENYKKSVQDLDKTLEETLKHLDELRKNQTEVIFNELDKTLSKGRGLDMVEEEWKLINDLSNRYLDNVERALETELYTNDLEKAANAIGLSAENQAKLNSFMDDELTKLKAKNKLTQYDIDESRARLAILQAEIALEEQRNNKSKMRLRRDSQGNYNYQYVGDEQAIEDAENGVLTAKKEWYELVKKRYKDVHDYTIELRKQEVEYNRQANEAEANNDYEKAEFLRSLAEEVKKEIEQNNSEIGKNTQDLIFGTAQYFAEVENASILPTSSTVAATLIDDFDSVEKAVTKAVKELDRVQTEYVKNTQDAISEAGVEYEQLREDGIDPTTESLEDLVDTQEDLADKLEDVNDELDTQEENLKKCEDAYRNLKDAAVDAIEAANTALEKLSQTAIDTQQKVAASVAAAQSAANASASGGSSSYGGGSSSGQEQNGATTGTHSYRVVPANPNLPYSGLFKIVDENGTRAPGTDEGTLKDLQKYKKKYNITGLKTGGYTGDWSGEKGKLAILHQKELVLNESDTSNILSAVKSIREIVGNGINSVKFDGIADAIVKMSAMQASMLSQISQSTLGALASTINNNNSEVQNYKNMTINADFSGVRSADAIYQALRELENYGMQQSYSVAPHNNTSY